MNYKYLLCMLLIGQGFLMNAAEGPKTPEHKIKRPKPEPAALPSGAPSSPSSSVSTEHTPTEPDISTPLIRTPQTPNVRPLPKVVAVNNHSDQTISVNYYRGNSQGFKILTPHDGFAVSGGLEIQVMPPAESRLYIHTGERGLFSIAYNPKEEVVEITKIDNSSVPWVTKYPVVGRYNFLFVDVYSPNQMMEKNIVTPIYIPQIMQKR